MKTVSAAELADSVLGVIGTPRRDAFELEVENEIKNERLARQLKKERLRQKITQEELGERLGVKKSYISSVENTKHNVSMDVLSRVARALGMEINYTLSPMV
ncbi:MAG: helix-turn-helix domain-containing protein [Mangrovibacterium sp.]